MDSLETSILPLVEQLQHTKRSCRPFKRAVVHFICMRRMIVEILTIENLNRIFEILQKRPVQPDLSSLQRNKSKKSSLILLCLHGKVFEKTKIVIQDLDACSFSRNSKKIDAETRPRMGSLRRYFVSNTIL